MDQFNLKAKLEAGASRVFNCLRLTQDVLASPVADPAQPLRLFFRARSLNDLIVIKEPNLAREAGAGGKALPVRTKLFLPFNTDDPYAGGLSIFTDDPAVDQVLRDRSGGDQLSAAALELDMLKVRMLEQLPSLDPFLLKDMFAAARVDVNEGYFRLSETEWQDIKNHIGAKFALMCSFAGAREEDPVAIARLVERIWSARDIGPVLPLLQSLGLPADRAPELFYAWKGISYFDYEFNLRAARLRGFIAWVQATQPRGPAHRVDRESIEEDRRQLRERLRGSIGSAQGILKDYSDSFDMLFRQRQTARNFADFMIDSRRHFWTLGSNLNGILHAVAVWHEATGRVPDRTLPPAQLVRLMRTLRDIV
jgi:hypothetical protein